MEHRPTHPNPNPNLWFRLVEHLPVGLRRVRGVCPGPAGLKHCLLGDASCSVFAPQPGSSASSATTSKRPIHGPINLTVCYTASDQGGWKATLDQFQRLSLSEDRNACLESMLKTALS